MVVDALLWLAALFLPIVAAFGLTVPRLRDALIPIAPWTALPALAVALIPNAPEFVSVPWLLLDSWFGLHLETSIFLLLTALLWLLSGVYAVAYTKHDPSRHRFWVFFLLTMAGNFGLIVALDVATFYFSFALMTFAAFGLIVHEGSWEAIRAGRVYIVMAVLGEVMLMTSFIMLAFEADDISITALSEELQASPYRLLIVFLLISGFGVKAGVIPLHIWLPLAHPVAPTPASAVLSGAMIKAGLLGWLRFLPLGGVSMENVGTLIIVVGFGAAFAAAIVGVFQRDPKSVLAYSSISQMGIITSGIGVVFIEPDTWQFMATAIAFYALHHGLAKGALFLGVGVVYADVGGRWQRNVVSLVMLVPALALVGAPLTSGTAAKTALKDPLSLTPGQWEQWHSWLLLIAAVGTTILMARFLYLLRPGVVRGDPHHPLEPGLWVPWVALILASSVSAWFVRWHYETEGIEPLHLSPQYLWESLWPILAGLVLSWVTYELRGHGYAQRIREIPPGDILVIGERITDRFVRPVSELVLPAIRFRVSQIQRLRETARISRSAGAVLAESESALVRVGTAGVVLLAMMTVLLLLVWRG